MSNYPENDYRNYLEHSLGEWKVHKYIQKIGDRYIYPKTRKIATAVAGLSKKNRERKFYKEHGMSSQSYDRKMYRETGLTKGQRRRKAVADALRSIPGSIASAARSGANSLRKVPGEIKRRATLASARRDLRKRVAANEERRLYRETGLTKNQRRLSNLKSAASRTKQKARTAVASLKPKNLSRRLYRSTGKNARTIAASLRPRNIRRRFKRLTGK